MRQLRCPVFGDASLPIFCGAGLSLRHLAAKAVAPVTPVALDEHR